MKKRILNISLILAMASTGSVFAQQGFGTNTPDKSAAVDITSRNKGLLIPRVALQAENLQAPITSPKKSLLVYNTTIDTTKNLKEGFYFWNGTKWEAFTTASTDLNTTNFSLAVVNGKLTLTDSDNNFVDINVSDINTDDQQITTFEIGTNDVLTLTLENGGTKTVNLAPYFNSTKLDNGTNTTVGGTGTVGDPYKVNVATAKTLSLGVVMPGIGMTVDGDGKLNVTPVADKVTNITNTVSGHKIADYTNEANATVAINETITTLTGTEASGNSIGVYKNEEGANVTINETVTELKQNATTGIISYQPESGSAQTANVLSGVTGNVITYDAGVFLDAAKIQNNQEKTIVEGTGPITVGAPTISGNNKTYTVAVSVAKSDEVGVVKPGTGMTVDANGKLDVTFPVITGSETIVKAGDAPNATTVSGNGTSATPYVISSTDTNSKSVVTAAASNVVVTPSGPDASDITTYTVAVKNAMPKFFYMPSVLIDTSAASGSVNLYSTYTTQFGSPAVTSANAEVGGIPTLPVNMLDFYVTYYDSDVIDTISINANGEMTYTVDGAPTNLSFINVVFKVRDTPKP